MRTSLFLLLLLALLSATVSAQTPEFNEARFETALLAAMDTYEVPGVVVLLVEGDEIVYLAGLGENVEPDVAYDMGRLADTLTATLTLIQIEKGLLAVDRPMTDIAPNFRLALDPGATGRVTVERLLIHTAGLGNADLAPTESLSIQAANEVPFFTSYPGSRFSYCDRCYGLLTTLLTLLNGQSYADLLTAEMFYPLHMDNSRVEGDRIFSPAADLAHFISLHLQKGRWRDVQLLTPESVKETQRSRLDTNRNMIEAIGYGWFVESGVLPDVEDIEINRVITAYDMGDYRAAMSLIPAYNRGVLLISPDPLNRRSLDALLDIAHRRFTGWESPEPPLPTVSQLPGEFLSDDPVWGGTILIEGAEADLEITFNGETSSATFVDERTLHFELEAGEANLWFTESGKPFQAVLTINGETAVFDRHN